MDPLDTMEIAKAALLLTLTFVPKLVVLGIVMLLSLPMIGAALSNFMAQIATRIIAG